MGTIGLAHTLSDLRKQLNPDGSIDRVMEVLNQSNPVMQHIPMLEGDLPIGNKTTIRASLPSPSVRRINQGTAPTKGTTKQIIDVCMSLEDRSRIDVNLLKGKPNPEQYRSNEDDAHVEGMGQYVASKIFYGDLDADPDTFNGLSVRYSTISGTTKGTASYQVTTSGQAGTNTNQSVWFIDWGDRRVTGIYPKGTQVGLSTQDLGESDVNDGAGNPYRAVQTLYGWDFGIAVQNVRSIAVCRNINTASLKAMTSANKLALIENLVYTKNRLQDAKNPIMYVADTMYSLLEMYLLDKNNVHVTRQDFQNGLAGIRFGGIPVFKLDCLKENEGTFS
jgi:hypothetical protein